jgi:hypothetical protein
VIVLSDREKGIYDAAREQLPANQHCYCVKYMKTRFTINFCEKLWLAAKTTSVSVFRGTMFEGTSRCDASNSSLQLKRSGLPQAFWSGYLIPRARVRASRHNRTNEFRSFHDSNYKNKMQKFRNMPNATNFRRLQPFSRDLNETS